jgi:hypothetical protein
MARQLIPIASRTGDCPLKTPLRIALVLPRYSCIKLVCDFPDLIGGVLRLLEFLLMLQHAGALHR